MKIYDQPFVDTIRENEHKIDEVLVMLEDAYNQSSTASITNQSMSRLTKQTYEALKTFKQVVNALYEKREK